MSLERLIRLAKKTGDRLIVHDSVHGNDVVILGVDEYEKMFDRAQDTGNYSHDEDVLLDDDYGHDTLGDSVPSSWHSTAAVMAERFERTSPPWQENTEQTSPVSDIDDRDILPPLPRRMDVLDTEDAAPLPSDNSFVPDDTQASVGMETATENDVVPEERHVIPLVQSESEIVGEEEPIKHGDDPVFYEEPV